MASRKILSFTLAAFLAVSSVAQAAPTAAERETARRLMDEGKARLKANEVARAVDAFQKAHDIMHVPTTGIALARAHLAAGHLVEARDAALEVGRMPHESGDPAVFETARKHAKELDAQLKPRIPTVRIKVKNGTPSRVTVDDIEIPSSIIGEPVAVNPGKRVISARSADGAETKGEIELAERDAKEIELTFPAPSDAGKARTANKSAAAVSPAPRKVTGFGNDGDLGPAGERTPLAEALVYGGFGLAVVGLGVGSVTGAMTLSKASDVEPRCANDICAPEARSDLDSANTLATVSTFAFIAGGAFAVAGVVGLFLPRRPAPGKTGSLASGNVSSLPTRGWGSFDLAPRSHEGRSVTIGPAGIGGTF
jgi:hypothetical protein